MIPEPRPISCNPLRCYLKKVLTTKYNIVFVTHTQTTWDEQRRFSGFYDAPISKSGRLRALRIGDHLKQKNIKFDLVFCSVLNRTQQTARIILKELNQPDVPIKTSWKLNERHYGALTGLTIQQAIKKYGKNHIHSVMSNIHTNPPPINENHSLYKLIFRDPRYEKEPYISEFPGGESIQTVITRAASYWDQHIAPAVKSGKSILICAHEDSLRGIAIRLLDMIDENDIENLTIPRGIPFNLRLNINLHIIGVYIFKRLAEKVYQKEPLYSKTDTSNLPIDKRKRALMFHTCCMEPYKATRWCPDSKYKPKKVID